MGRPREAESMMQIDEPLGSWMILSARLCLAGVYLVSGIHKGVCYQKAQAEFRAAGIPADGSLEG